MTRTTRPAFGTLLFFAIAFALSLYFTFAAVQGDFGLFRRTEIVAENQKLSARLQEVRAEVARMENLTKRLSDDYLDLDLLDERARKVLGMVRTELAKPGTELEVEIYGEKFKAVVQEDQPLWDPANERLRA